LGALNKWSEPYDGKTPQHRMAEAREVVYNAKARKQANIPEWKRPLKIQ
jgi:hypothetical protein